MLREISLAQRAGLARRAEELVEATIESGARVRGSRVEQRAGADPLARHTPGGDPRLPPGQYDAGATFPVLTADVTPRLDLDRWTLRVDGLVQQAQEWSGEGVRQLPVSRRRCDRLGR